MKRQIQAFSAAYARLQRAGIYEQLFVAACFCTLATALLQYLREDPLPISLNAIQLLWVLPGILLFLAADCLRGSPETPRASTLERASLLLVAPIYAEPFRASLQSLGLEPLRLVPLLFRSLAIAVVYFLLHLLISGSRKTARAQALDALLSAVFFAFSQSVLCLILARLGSNALRFPSKLQARLQSCYETLRERLPKIRRRKSGQV